MGDERKMYEIVYIPGNYVTDFRQISPMQGKVPVTAKNSEQAIHKYKVRYPNLLF